jgi:hypothetical protein
MNQDSAELPIWIFFALPVFFAAFWCGICYLSAFLSGWRRLAVSYTTTEQPTGAMFPFSGGYVGMFTYRGSLHLAAASEGLFLWPILPFRIGYARLFIPWADLSATPEKSLLLEWVVLRAARAPKVKVSLRRSLADKIARASDGGLKLAES